MDSNSNAETSSLDTGDLPSLISVFDSVLHQLMLIIKEIEETRSDAAVLLRIVDGRLVINGLGHCKEPDQVAAMLLLGMQGVKATGRDAVASAAEAMMIRSHEIEKEAALWRTSPNLRQPP